MNIDETVSYQVDMGSSTTVNSVRVDVRLLSAKRSWEKHMQG